MRAEQRESPCKPKLSGLFCVVQVQGFGGKNAFSALAFSVEGRGFVWQQMELCVFRCVAPFGAAHFFVLALLPVQEKILAIAEFLRYNSFAAQNRISICNRGCVFLGKNAFSALAFSVEGRGFVWQQMELCVFRCVAPFGAAHFFDFQGGYYAKL